MKTIPRLFAVFSMLVVTASPYVPAFAEEALGRLFFTPERRQTLDRQRQFNIQEKQEIPEDPTFTIDGVVTRSSGKRTVWVNGIAQNDNETSGGATLLPIKQQSGVITIQSATTPGGTAKVGDTVNRTTGEATDALKGGRVLVNQGSTR